MLSTTSWRVSRAVPAPMAARIAISRRRALASASRTLATFAVAVISRSATAASSTRRAGRTSAVICSIAGTARISARPLPPNSATAVMPGSGALLARAVPSALACSGVAPGRSRASAEKIDICSTLPSYTGGGAHGVHARVSRSGNANAFGMTPTTVIGFPSTRTTRPIAASGPPNRSCERPYDRTITPADDVWGATPVFASASTNSRPRSGAALTT